MRSVSHLRSLKSDFEGKRKSYLIIALMFFIGASVTGALAFSGIHFSERVKYLITLGIFALLGIYFAWNWSVNRNQSLLTLFELPVWFTLSAFVNMGVAAYFAFVDSRWREPYLSDHHWLLVALFLVLTGVVSLWIGYRFAGALRFGSKKTEKSPRWRELASPVNLGLVYGLIIGNRILRIVTVGTAYGSSILPWLLPFNQWMIYLDEASYLIVAITVLEVSKGRWPSCVLYTVLATETFFIFISGMTRGLIWLSVVTIAASLYGRRRIPRRWFILILALWVILVPVNQILREGYGSTRSVFVAAEHVGESFKLAWFSQPWSKNWEALIEKILGRQSSLLQNVAAVIELTPSVIPFSPITDYLYLPLYLVPRFVWQSKPMLSPGVWFGVTYLGSPSTTRSSAAISPFGDLYMHGGWLGLLMGMFLVGVLYRVLYKIVMIRSSDPKVVLYFSLFIFATDVEANIQGIFQGIIQRLVIYYLLTRFIYKRISVGTSCTNDQRE